MFRTFLSVILAASIASVFPQSSGAETASKMVSVRVYYGDLDLATDAGAQTLLKRLNWAGKQVCGWQVPTGSAKSILQHRACMRETVSSAVAKLGLPGVTAQLTARN